MPIESSPLPTRLGTNLSYEERQALIKAKENAELLEAVRQEQPGQKAQQVIDQIYLILNLDKPEIVAADNIDAIIVRYVDHQIQQINQTLGVSVWAELYGLLEQVNLLLDTSNLSLVKQQRAVTLILTALLSLPRENRL